MSENEFVPYEATPLGKQVPTKWLSATLKSGAEVRVGLQREHPLGGESGIGLVHVMRNDQPEGYRSQLVFSLTPEACVALVMLYIEHGILDSVIVKAVEVKT